MLLVNIRSNVLQTNKNGKWKSLMDIAVFMGFFFVLLDASSSHSSLSGIHWQKKRVKTSFGVKICSLYTLLNMFYELGEHISIYLPILSFDNCLFAALNHCYVVTVSAHITYKLVFREGEAKTIPLSEKTLKTKHVFQIVFFSLLYRFFLVYSYSGDYWQSYHLQQLNIPFANQFRWCR